MTVLVAIVAAVPALLAARAMRRPDPTPWDGTRAWAHHRTQLRLACTRVSAGKIEELD